MTRGNGCLDHIRAAGAAQRRGAVERGQAAANQELIPQRAVLVEQQNRFACGPDARARTRGLDLHQGDEAVHFRLARGEPGEDSTQTYGVVAEAWPHPIVTGRRGIAFVENEIEDAEHRRHSFGELRPARDLEGNLLLRERPLGADDALRDRRFRNEERSRDLVGCQAAKQPQRQRDLRFARQDGMTRDEHEPEQVIAHVVVEGRVEIRPAIPV